MDIRDRVRELRKVRARDLRKNPRNYRLHPEGQRGLLEEVGYVDALIARETPDGLELIDGHMRSEETPDMEVPVLIVDLADDEVDKVLVTLDPVAAMAKSDEKILGALLAGIETQNADLRRFITDAADACEDIDAIADATDEDRTRDVPGMGLEPHEHYDYLVVLCTSTHEWNVLLDRLGLEPVERRGRMGTCRGIRAEKLFDLLTRTAGG